MFVLTRYLSRVISLPFAPNLAGRLLYALTLLSFIDWLRLLKSFSLDVDLKLLSSRDYNLLNELFFNNPPLINIAFDDLRC